MLIRTDHLLKYREFHTELTLHRMRDTLFIARKSLSLKRGEH